MGLPAAQPVHRDVHLSSAGTLDERFVASLACDVSFISDESVAPETLVAQQAGAARDPRHATLLWSIFDRLRREYDAGRLVAHPACVQMHIQQAMSGTIDFDDTDTPALLSFFDRINRVLFEHQTLAWLAESQFKLHLYGLGWESNSAFARYARGPIESDAMRLAVTRASRVNLAACVYGAVDGRVIEGIKAGGFYLLRYCPADVIERIFPPLWDFCQSHGIANNAQLSERATPAIRALIAYASRTIGAYVLDAWPDFVGVLRASAERGYTQSAAAVWPQYPSIAFSSRDELLGLVGRYLYDVPMRQRVADEMRKALVTRFEHVRVNKGISPPRAEAAA